MLDDFITYNKKENLFRQADKIMLAVSGGVDSVVMTELFRQAGVNFGMAHVNFNLRGAESDRDEDFVRGLAAKYQVPLYIRHFQTKSYARQNKLSVQVAARQLRYQWFQLLLGESDYAFVATAHNMDDQIETFLINLARGTGIAGLRGIPARQDQVIRPLLFASRDQIVNFARDNQLNFVEDSSNRSLHYSRNRIRHRIIPQMEQLNPSFRKEMRLTMEHISDAWEIYRQAIERERDRILVPSRNNLMIPVNELKKLSPGKTWLFEFISGFGFSAATVNDIWEALDEQPGKVFFSQTHRLVKDRENLIIEPLSRLTGMDISSEASINDFTGDFLLEHPVRLHFKKILKEGYEIPGQPEVASFDQDKVDFPLSIRRWEKGDHFYPFGLAKRKKLSDFFIDLKLSLPQKENAWLLISGGRIAWVIGHRTDERFRIDDGTSRILQVRIVEPTDR